MTGGSATSASVTALSVGSHSITASYTPDTSSNYAAGTSPALNQSVNQATATLTLNGLSQTQDGNPKTVTVVTGFVGIGEPEKDRLAKAMRAACGCGGTVKEGRIEIQGDQRETVARILAEAGFRPVFAGG